MSEEQTIAETTTIETTTNNKDVRQRVKTMIDSSKAAFNKTKTVASAPQLYVTDHSSKFLNLITLSCIMGSKYFAKKKKKI